MIQLVFDPAKVHHHLVELLVDAVELLITKLKLRLKDGETIAELRPNANDGEDASDKSEDCIKAERHVHCYATQTSAGASGHTGSSMSASRRALR